MHKAQDNLMDTCKIGDMEYKMHLLDKIILKDSHENCGKKPSE